jgi:hypothetical protein
MFKIINNTPLETNVTLHGSFRIFNIPPESILSIDSAPSWTKYPTEWLYILKNGPLYKQMTYLVEPWTEIETYIISNSDTSCTLGFNDYNTQWAKHTTGVYSWDSKYAEIELICKPKKPNLRRNGRGPVIAQDIDLNIQAKSENSSWKVCDSPITMVRYSPNFNYGYYQRRER